MSSHFLTGVEEKYDKRLLENRITNEGNVIACLYNDPLLFDEYELKATDFITNDGEFFFKIGSHLRKKRYSVLDEVTLYSKLPEEIIKRLDDKGGYDAIRKIMESVDNKNADAYIDDLVKENMLLKFHREGFPLFETTQWKDKDVVIIDVLRTFDSQGVIDWWESKLASFEPSKSGVVLEEEVIDFTDEFIDSLADGDADGVPFETAGEDINGEEISCYKFLSKQVSGLLYKTLSMIGGFSSAGKSTWITPIILSLLLQDEKVILISNEEEIKKYKMKIMVWVLNKHFKYYKLTKKKLQSGDISDEDREQIKKFQKYWRENFKDKFMIVAINDSDFATAKKKIRKAALDKGFSVFILDTFKIEQSDMNNSRTDLALVRNCRELHKLAQKYNMIGLASVQLAESMKGTLFLDASVLSNAKQLKEDLENLFLMRNVYPEELDSKHKLYCNPFRHERDGDKWIEKQFDASQSDVWRMLFVEKNRNGANSSDNGIAYLLKFNGDYALFVEKAKCRPKHGRIQ